MTGLAFDGLGLEALREEWRARYGAPPRLRSPQLLALMLAWRIQTEAEGGLPPEVRRALRSPGVAKVRSDPSPGALLVREWQGVRHEVIVMREGGFLYEGDRYASLSQVARRITGVRWNGPRFFGLREAKGAA